MHSKTGNKTIADRRSLRENMVHMSQCKNLFVGLLVRRSTREVHVSFLFVRRATVMCIRVSFSSIHLSDVEEVIPSLRSQIALSNVSLAFFSSDGEPSHERVRAGCVLISLKHTIKLGLYLYV